MSGLQGDEGQMRKFLGREWKERQWLLKAWPLSVPGKC